MFHMLSCFNLRDGATAQAPGCALRDFAAVMASQNLLEAVGPIGRRDAETEMDTDDERPHQFFYIMSFTDKAQCNRAYDFIDNPTGAARAAHEAVVTKIQDNIHICWQDIDVTEVASANRAK